MSMHSGPHGGVGGGGEGAVEQGVRKSLERQNAGRKAVATGPAFLKFMARFTRPSVFVLHLTFPQIALYLFLLVLFQLLLGGFSGSQVLQACLESLIN